MCGNRTKTCYALISCSLPEPAGHPTKTLLSHTFVDPHLHGRITALALRETLGRPCEDICASISCLLSEVAGRFALVRHSTNFSTSCLHDRITAATSSDTVGRPCEGITNKSLAFYQRFQGDSHSHGISQFFLKNSFVLSRPCHFFALSEAVKRPCEDICAPISCLLPEVAGHLALIRHSTNFLNPSFIASLILP